MRTFQTATHSEFQDLIEAYPFTRSITDVHLHHTWKPRRRDYRGLATIEGMWRYHTGNNGWEDIAQHVTIAPDGDIWLCRNFNWVPASARGFNGNRTAGPFMIELIGDFDEGMDDMPVEQLNSTLSVIRAIQSRFQLPASALRFHCEMSSKSCPGSNMDKSDWIERLESYVPSASRSIDDLPFPKRAGRYRELLEAMSPDARQQHESIGAEHECGDASNSRGVHGSNQSRGLDDDALDRLADHVINLERGRLSTSGRIETTMADIDRLFQEVLVNRIDAARAEGRKFHIVFFAHGGLVSEKNALKGALAQLDFWLDNGIYPIFFVWETGMAETIKQLVGESFARGIGERGVLPRGSFKDSAIELLARALGGDTIWAGMQSSAQLASATGGGAHHVARKMGQLFKRFSSDVQVHAVGHSAGSIFNAHFMSELAARKVKIRSAHFLAPAIRNDLFHQTVAPLLGKKIKHLSLFTMNKRLEKRDTVAKIYGQSLLYLIYEALERKKKTPILGLEESLRGDKKARLLFGLNGAVSDKAEVIFSPSDDAGGGSASNARTHGGFDEDPSTMESVARRILDRRRGEAIERFPTDQQRDFGSYWEDQFEWPEELADMGQSMSTNSLSLGNPETPLESATSPAQSTDWSFHNVSSLSQNGNLLSADSSSALNGKQRRVTALCIGINAYERSPLAGCVADARLWARTLDSLGFVPEVMVDDQATGDAIRQRLTRLVQESLPGDHLVFQFAGHGTQFEDTSGDESSDNGAALDECLCAFDCESSDQGLVIDDEIRAILDTIPDGVSMTCFFDCCHAGSATRMFVRRSPGAEITDTRARFVNPSRFMMQAYQRRLGEVRQRSRQIAPLRKEVLLSSSVGRLSNLEFLERVLESFGDQARQTPQIDCEFSERSKQLLGGHSGHGEGPSVSTEASVPPNLSGNAPGNGVWKEANTPDRSVP